MAELTHLTHAAVAIMNLAEPSVVDGLANDSQRVESYSNGWTEHTLLRQTFLSEAWCFGSLSTAGLFAFDDFVNLSMDAAMCLFHPKNAPTCPDPLTCVSQPLSWTSVRPSIIIDFLLLGLATY